MGKARAKARTTSISIGDISNVSGEVTVAGGDVSIRKTTGLSAGEFARLFEQLAAAMEARGSTAAPGDQAKLANDVQAVQSAITKAAETKTEIDKGFLEDRFRNIARMAPDVLEVILTSLGSPAAGLGLAVKLVAEKAKKEARANG